MQSRKLIAAWLVFSFWMASYCLGRTQSVSATAPHPPSGLERDVALREVLRGIGKTCGCFFTLEEGHASGEYADAMEEARLPASLIDQSPPLVIEQLTKVIPHFSYQVDRVDGRIIHIRDDRLLKRPRYPLDEKLGSFEYYGRLCRLPQVLADKGLALSGIAQVSISPDGQLDFQTIVRVVGSSMDVRTALTNFIPLETEVKGKVLWIAETDLDDPRLMTNIHFPLF